MTLTRDAQPGTRRPASVRAPRRRRRGFNVLGAVTSLVGIALWQLIASVGPLADVRGLPAPVEVVVGFTQLISRGDLLEAIVHTSWVTMVSAASGIVAGLIIGTILGLVPLFRVFTGTTWDALRSVPMVAIMPVALLLWGPDAKTEIIVATIASTWPMLVNTDGGIRSVHPRLAEVGRVFQFPRMKTVLKLQLPAASPQLIVGARLTVVTALIASIVAEMLISPAGLGFLIVTSQNALQYAQMWAVVVVCGFFGLLLNIVLLAGSRRLSGGRG